MNWCTFIIKINIKGEISRQEMCTVKSFRIIDLQKNSDCFSFDEYMRELNYALSKTDLSTEPSQTITRKPKHIISNSTESSTLLGV